MQNTKLFLKHIIEPICEVESNHSKDIKYQIYKVRNSLKCSCMAGSMGQECSHIKKINKIMGNIGKCFYCGKTQWAAGGLEEHHVLRRSTNPELIDDPKNKMMLCRKCHSRATEDTKFENNLQELWYLREQLVK